MLNTIASATHRARAVFVNPMLASASVKMAGSHPLHAEEEAHGARGHREVFLLRVPPNLEQRAPQVLLPRELLLAHLLPARVREPALDE